MNKKMYDVLKWIAQYLLPSAGTFYFALSTIWGLPYGEQVIGTLTAADIFLGVLIGVSATQYNKSSKDGTLMVDTSNPAKDIYKLSLDIPLEDIAGKDTISLKVDTGANLTDTVNPS